MLADVAARQRDVAALREYAPLAEKAASRYDHRLYQAIAQRAWGVAHRLAGEFEQAEGRLNRSLERFRSLETRWQTGHTFVEKAELALACGDTAGARRYSAHALTMFEELGAVPDATRARTTLARLG